MTPKSSRLSRFKVPGLLAFGFCIGVVINQLGFVMEKIWVRVELVKSNKSSSPHSTFQELMHRLPHLHQSFAASEYVVPNIVHYFWFADNSTKISFTEFLSVLSAYRIQQPNAVWFHCNRLPDVNDFHWRQLWKFVPLTVLYHDPQTGQHKLNNGLKSARNSAVVATLLKHGGMFIDWNILVMRSLNPLRNYSTCFSKQESDSLQTDIILSGSNATFLQLVSSSLQLPETSLSRVVSRLLGQQPNLMHVESISSIATDHSMSDKGGALKSQYIIRIPAERQDDTEKSIRTGRDLLSTAMRYIYYGSTDPLS